MINKISYILTVLISLLPLFLITGPAIPDIVITFTGVFFIFFSIYEKNYFKLLNNNFIKFSFIFWLYLIFISIFAENKKLSFNDSVIFIRILLIPILILFWYSNDKKRLERVITIIFLIVIFVTLDTFYQYINYNSATGFGEDILGFVPNWYGRLTGPFGDELIPGAYLSKFALLGWIYLLLKNKSKNKIYIFSLIYISFVGLTIFATGERMALATYLMALIFLFVFLKNKRIILLSSIALTLLLILIAERIHPIYNDYKIIESTPYHLGLKVEKKFLCENDMKKLCYKTINLQPTFTQVVMNFNESAYGEIYKLAIKMYQDHKVFGIGLNNFTYLCFNDQRYNKIMKKYSCVTHPHNLYIQWLVEAGIIGLIMFIIYLMIISYKVLKNKYNEYNIIGLATLLILFWPLMSTGSLLKNWNGITTFFIIGLIISLNKLKEKN